MDVKEIEVKMELFYNTGDVKTFFKNSPLEKRYLRLDKIRLIYRLNDLQGITFKSDVFFVRVLSYLDKSEAIFLEGTPFGTANVEFNEKCPGCRDDEVHSKNYHDHFVNLPE